MLEAWKEEGEGTGGAQWDSGRTSTALARPDRCTRAIGTAAFGAWMCLPPSDQQQELARSIPLAFDELRTGFWLVPAVPWRWALMLRRARHRRCWRCVGRALRARGGCGGGLHPSKDTRAYVRQHISSSSSSGGGGGGNVRTGNSSSSGGGSGNGWTGRRSFWSACRGPRRSRAACTYNARVHAPWAGACIHSCARVWRLNGRGGGWRAAAARVLQRRGWLGCRVGLWRRAQGLETGAGVWVWITALPTRRWCR